MECVRNRGKRGPSILPTHGKARSPLLETGERPKTKFSPWPTTRESWPTSFLPWRPKGWSTYQKRWSADHLVWQPPVFRHVSPEQCPILFKSPSLVVDSFHLSFAQKMEAFLVKNLTAWIASLDGSEKLNFRGFGLNALFTLSRTPLHLPFLHAAAMF